ncbi:MAG: tetratricopeptide repeat protein [Candidatus Cloacimonetes bacterium]|nr:tetratricopeptide repeat protein [Candidatus Cloacimonadota bacterium]
MHFRLLYIVCFCICSTLLGAATNYNIGSLEKRLNAYPSNLKLKYVLSRAYASKGKKNPAYYEKSIGQLNGIIKVKQIPVVKFYLGLMHARKGELDKAIYHWLTIVRSLKPNSLTTLRYLALALAKKKRHQESLKYWNKVLKLNPDDYKAHFHSGLVTLRDLSIEKNLRYSNAIKHFRKVLKHYPKHRKTLWYLGMTYKKSQQFLKQRKVLNRLLVLTPGNKKILREVQRNQKNLATNPVDRVLRPVVRDTRPPVEPNDIVVTESSSAISEDDFNTAFGQDPEPQETPIVHEPEAVDTNPMLNNDSPLSADAELLFNQGVTYKQNKEYDLALFNFLQAAELDTKFAQCYLQIGEVYLKLSDSTPTNDKFNEHLDLSNKALITAIELEPDSLLAHAAKARQIQVGKKRDEGFERAHLRVAQAAYERADYRFAFEEYMVLLVNNITSPELIFSLSDLLPHVDDGVKMDLVNVLQSLREGSKEDVKYLLGKLQMDTDQDDAWALFEDIFKLTDISNKFFSILKSRYDNKQFDGVDLYLLGRHLLRASSIGPSVKFFEAALQKEEPGLKSKVNVWLKKARSNPGTTSNVARVVTKTTRSSSKDFQEYEREKDELLSVESSLSGLFQDSVDFGVLSEKTQFLQAYVQENSKNVLAKFLLAVLWDRSGVTEHVKRAEEMKSNLIDFYPYDSDWHLKMGILALKMDDATLAKQFFDKTSYILLSRGWEVYEYYALELSNQAERALKVQDNGVALSLIKYGFGFNPNSINLAKAQTDLLEKTGQGGFGYSTDFFFKLLEDEIYYEVFKGDVGLIFFWATYCTLLILSFALFFKKREEFKHVIDELAGGGSLSIPLISMVGGVLILFFPTGLVIFLPIVLWTFLDDFEQMAFGVGICILMFMPFVFPVGYVNNQPHLKALSFISNGEYKKAQKIYHQRVSLNPLDMDARFQLALIKMNEADGAKKAISMFKSIVAEDLTHFEALGNIGVCFAKIGDYNSALSYLNKAYKVDPLDDKVLYNLSRVNEAKGELKTASNFMKWLGGSGDKRSKALIDRYIAVSSASTPIFAPFYLKKAVQKHNTFFAPVYNSWLSLSLFLFVMWFFLGGGFVAYLLFMKDKIQVVISYCRYCSNIICGNCQSVLGSETLCSDCFDSDSRRAKGLRVFKKERDQNQDSMASKLNLVLPGFFQIVRGDLMVGLFISFLTMLFFMVWFHSMGYVWSQVFYYENSFTSVIQYSCLLVAFLLYAVSQVLALNSK